MPATRKRPWPRRGPSSRLSAVPPFSRTELRARLHRALEAERDAMRDLLCALVAIPTENPPGRSYEPCVALIESALTRAQIEHRRIPIPRITPTMHAVL